MTSLGSRTRVLLAAFGAAFLVAGGTGCNQVQAPGLARGNAPGIDGEPASMRGHNVAAPNAPFSVLASAPKLATREPILDVHAVPDCVPAQLSLFETRARSAGMHHTLRLTLANTDKACRLGGFPAVSLLGADGSVLAAVRVQQVSESAMQATLLNPGEARVEATAEDAPSPLVLLASHDEASFELGWTSGPSCLEVSRIAVAAPGTTQSVLLNRPLAVCEQQLLITAVAPEGLN